MLWILVIVNFVVGGFTLMWTWNWFMTPFGLPQISFAWAIGLNLLGGLITGTSGIASYIISKDNDKKEQLIKSSYNLLAVYLVILLESYICSLFL